MSNELTITSGTSLTQLNHFLEGANKGQKILARHDDEGHIVLYAKSNRTTILDRILGRMDRRQERARQGIQLVFDRFAARNTRTGVSGQAGTKTLFDHIGSQLSDKAHHGGIRVGDVSAMVEATTAVLRALPDGTDAPVQQPRGPSLRSVGMNAGDAEISATARKIDGTKEDYKTAEKLGKYMADTFMATNPSTAQRQAFAFSGGMALKRELKEALKAATSEMGLEPKLGNLGLDIFAESVVNHAASKIFPDGIVDSETTIEGRNKKSVTLPHIEIGGTEYKPSCLLGVGGFADVYEYVSVDDPDSKMAFKLTRLDEDRVEPNAASIDDAAKEIEIHRSAYGNGDANVLAMKGAVRLPDGRIGIALEVASNGTVHEMGVKISDAIGNGPGKITQAEADILRLTMLKDMARGLEHMHYTQGVTHYDFKSPNCFIGADGVVKVADFGLSHKAGKHGEALLKDAGTVDNPLYKAPELMRAETVRSRLDDLEKDTRGFETKRAHDKLEKLLPNADEAVIDILTNSVMAPRRQQLEKQKLADQSGLFYGREVDMWGMGASALEIFTGHKPVDHYRFNSDAQEKLEAYGANRNSEPLSDPDDKGNPRDGSIGLRTGNQQIDQFLTDMLKPDPRDRATARDVINHQAMATKGVDSPEAKALILALHGNDPVQIARARRALADVM